MTNVDFFLVGGAVRDLIRGVRSNDLDFAVEAESFDHMRQWLIENNFVIFAETPKYFTIRARAPRDSFRFANMDLTSHTFDFTMCRKDGQYTDGRHPDVVEIGTIYDDLARRDFTINAVAIAQDGTYIDPHGGIKDIENELIRCVGGIDRLKEDGLRVLRAFRFLVQLGFSLDRDIYKFLQSKDVIDVIRPVSIDRIRDEVGKTFKADSSIAITYFSEFYRITEFIFNEKGVWLIPTTKNN